MRRTLLKLLVVTLSLSVFCTLSCKKSTPGPSPSKVNLKDGLLVYLPFDGNMADSSGNGNTTTSAGMTLTYDEHGYSNSAAQGAGSGERLLVNNNGSIKFDTAFTFSMNCMIRESRIQVFAAMVNYSTGSGLTFEVCANIPNSPVLDFGVSNSDVGCDLPGNPSNTPTDTTQFVLQPESWYNIVSVYHKGTMQIYANGNLISTKTGLMPNVRICPDAKLIIGGWWQNDPLSVNGKFDEIRLYNRVLTSDEIAKLAEDFNKL